MYVQSGGGGGGGGDGNFIPKWAAILPNLIRLMAALNQVWSMEWLPMLAKDATARWVLSPSPSDFHAAVSDTLDGCLGDSPNEYVAVAVDRLIFVLFLCHEEDGTTVLVVDIELCGFIAFTPAVFRMQNNTGCDDLAAQRSRPREYVAVTRVLPWCKWVVLAALHRHGLGTASMRAG